jgi:hypothetical protein
VGSLDSDEYHSFNNAALGPGIIQPQRGSCRLIEQGQQGELNGQWQGHIDGTAAPQKPRQKLRGNNERQVVEVQSPVRMPSQRRRREQQEELEQQQQREQAWLWSSSQQPQAEDEKEWELTHSGARWKARHDNLTPVGATTAPVSASMVMASSSQ